MGLKRFLNCASVQSHSFGELEDNENCNNITAEPTIKNSPPRLRRRFSKRVKAFRKAFRRKKKKSTLDEQGETDDDQSLVSGSQTFTSEDWSVTEHSGSTVILIDARTDSRSEVSESNSKLSAKSTETLTENAQLGVPLESHESHSLDTLKSDNNKPTTSFNCITNLSCECTVPYFAEPAVTNSDKKEEEFEPNEGPRRRKTTEKSDEDKEVLYFMNELESPYYSETNLDEVKQHENLDAPICTDIDQHVKPDSPADRTVPQGLLAEINESKVIADIASWNDLLQDIAGNGAESETVSYVSITESDVTGLSSITAETRSLNPSSVIEASTENCEELGQVTSSIEDIMMPDHKGYVNASLAMPASPSDSIIAQTCHDERTTTTTTTQSTTNNGEVHFSAPDLEIGDITAVVQSVAKDVEYLEGKEGTSKEAETTLFQTKQCNKQYVWNGQSVRVSTIQECFSCGNSSFWSKEDMPPELAYLQISPGDYEASRKHLQRCQKLRQYTLWYNRWLHSTVFMLLFLMLWIASFSIWTSQGLSVRVGAGFLFLLAVAVTVLGSCICGCIKRKFSSETGHTLSKVNELLSKYHIILGLVEEGALTCYRLSMHFLYFDIDPCLERLTQDLSNLVERKPSKKDKHKAKACDNFKMMSDTDKVILSEDITDMQRQDFARQLIFRYCDPFINALVADRIRRIRPGRHSADGPCLCQFIQQRFFNLKDEQLA